MQIGAAELRAASCPTMLRPTSTAFGPNANPNGMTSRVIPLMPPSIAPSPTRTNWCTAVLPPMKTLIGDRDMAAEHGAVGEGDVVADVAVVADMRIGHQEAAVADGGDFAVILGAGADGHAFADLAVAADRQPRGAAAISGRLRRGAERGKRIDHGLLADRRDAGKIDVRQQPHAGAQFHRWPDGAKRTDLDVVRQSSRRPPRVTKDRSAAMSALTAIMAPSSASATTSPPTLASPRNHHMFLRRLMPGHVVLEHVARHDRLAELGLVDGQEVDERRLLLSARHRADAERARGLRHALEHQHARHHRIVGKMAEELRLVGGDVLDADAVFVAADLDDAVDQQERIAVRQRGEDFANPDGLKRLAAHALVSPAAGAAINRRRGRSPSASASLSARHGPRAAGRAFAP